MGLDGNKREKTGGSDDREHHGGNQEENDEDWIYNACTFSTDSGANGVYSNDVTRASCNGPCGGGCASTIDPGKFP